MKYFGGEQHEGERYQDAIRQYQTLEYRVMSMDRPCFLALCLHIVLYSLAQYPEPCTKLHHRKPLDY